MTHRDNKRQMMMKMARITGQRIMQNSAWLLTMEILPPPQVLLVLKATNYSRLQTDTFLKILSCTCSYNVVQVHSSSVVIYTRHQIKKKNVMGRRSKLVVNERVCLHSGKWSVDLNSINGTKKACKIASVVVLLHNAPAYGTFDSIYIIVPNAKDALRFGHYSYYSFILISTSMEFDNYYMTILMRPFLKAETCTNSIFFSCMEAWRSLLYAVDDDDDENDMMTWMA